MYGKPFVVPSLSWWAALLVSTPRSHWEEREQQYFLKVERSEINRVVNPTAETKSSDTARWGNYTPGCYPLVLLSVITGRSPHLSYLIEGSFYCDLIAYRGWNVAGRNSISQHCICEIHGSHGQK